MKIIQNPKNAGAFAGLSGFLKNNPKYKKVNVERELLKTATFTQHTQPQKKFKRSKTIVPAIDHTWQADLIDVQKIKYQNSHYNFLLTVIDCFSKFAWVEPIKTKQAINTKKPFKKLLKNQKEFH